MNGNQTLNLIIKERDKQVANHHSSSYVQNSHTSPKLHLGRALRKYHPISPLAIFLENPQPVVNY